MRAKKTRSYRNTLWLLFILVPFFYYFTANLTTIVSMRSLERSLTEDLAQERAKAALLSEELSKVGTPAYYEYLARKLFGYMYDNEMMIILEDGPR